MIEYPSEQFPKQWFTDGATMRYHPRKRTIYWMINMGLFVLLNMFYLRIRIGEWTNIDPPYVTGKLIPTLLSPLNIFEYPSQIFTIGITMALLCTIPILTALLYNFLHSIPFILIVIIFGHNFELSMCLLASCIAVSFEPMRFKSKFVAAVLWLLPEVMYWGLYSGENPEQDALRWAMLYAPWGIAFLSSVMIFGIVIGIGHFIRYKPGVIMPIFGLYLGGTVTFFLVNIGMNEHNFQAYVDRFRPSRNPAFQDRSILPLIEKEMAERKAMEPYLTNEIIKKELRLQWRWAFNSISFETPSNAANEAVFKFYSEKYISLDAIKYFLDKVNPQHHRVADALYYMGLLKDLKIDPIALRDEDTLRYRHDFPALQSKSTWKQLIDLHRTSDPAIEARWRLARILASHQPEGENERFQFDQAQQLLNEAYINCKETIAKRSKVTAPEPFMSEKLGSLFNVSLPTITNERLSYLKNRISLDALLLGTENRTGHLEHEKRLAKFMSLDPHQLNYEQDLQELKINSPQPDPLLDNIEMAQTLLVKDIDERIFRLSDITKKHDGKDGGIHAMLELALLFLSERERTDSFADKQEQLTQARNYLQRIIKLRSGTYIAELSQELLNNNPIE